MYATRTRGAANSAAGRSCRSVLSMAACMASVHALRGAPRFVSTTTGFPRQPSVRLFSQVKVMSVEEFGKILNNAELRAKHRIIDVREPAELEAVSVSGDDVANMRLTLMEEWLPKVKDGDLLDKEQPTIVFCRKGLRGSKVATALAEECKFAEVYNVEGGMEKYVSEVDPSLGTF